MTCSIKLCRSYVYLNIIFKKKLWTKIQRRRYLHGWFPLDFWSDWEKSNDNLDQKLGDTYKNRWINYPVLNQNDWAVCGRLVGASNNESGPREPINQPGPTYSILTSHPSHRLHHFLLYLLHQKFIVSITLCPDNLFVFIICTRLSLVR